MAGPRRGKRERSDIKGARILIVEARYYDDIADLLLRARWRHWRAQAPRSSASACLGRSKFPVAIAIALDAAQQKRRKYEGAVALGCVIRGDTIHFEIVSHQSARGLMDLSIARACRSATA